MFRNVPMSKLMELEPRPFFYSCKKKAKKSAYLFYVDSRRPGTKYCSTRPANAALIFSRMTEQFTMRTRGSMPTVPTLSREDRVARQGVVVSIANELFSLKEGVERKGYYGVIVKEKKKMMNLYPWLTDGMLRYQMGKLAAKKREGVIIEAMLETAVEPDVLLDELEAEHQSKKSGRLQGTTEDALKTLTARKRNAADDAAEMYSAKKKRGVLNRGELALIISSAVLSNCLQEETGFVIPLATI